MALQHLRSYNFDMTKGPVFIKWSVEECCFAPHCLTCRTVPTGHCIGLLQMCTTGSNNIINHKWPCFTGLRVLRPTSATMPWTGKQESFHDSGRCSLRLLVTNLYAGCSCRHVEAGHGDR
jgi:hypothetical protein